jgi:molybdopterin-containing oxidoreductase family iron-sulfur binding subunit
VDEFLSKTELSKTSTSRRDFLKFLGFSVSAATLAACEAPVVKSVPYVVKPEEITPGIANYYASTYYDGVDYGSILVKTREGRPIHIEGNKLSGVTKGAVNARINSSVLSLYDGKRLTGPKMNGADASWADVDKAIIDDLNKVVAGGGKIEILSNTVISPSTLKLIDAFKSNFGTGSDGLVDLVGHTTYDSLSYAGLINANEASFGKAVIPSYNFDKAKVIVSISADFLNDWLLTTEYAPAYSANRKPEGAWMSKHVQFESRMSLTGSNADMRVAIKPSEQGKIAIALHNAIAKKAGGAKLAGGSFGDDNQGIQKKINDTAAWLWNNKTEGLVISGSNDESIQTIVNSINNMLGNYGNVIDLSKPVNVRKSNDKSVQNLITEIKAGKVDALIFMGTDPVYTMPKSWDFAGLLERVKVKISLADRMNETSALCGYVCPDNHFLESWNDANPKMGYYSLSQPVISKLFKTRQAQESLMKWANIPGTYDEFMKRTWESEGYPRQNKFSSFRSMWSKSLHDGIIEMNMPSSGTNEFTGDIVSASNMIAKISGGAWELELYTKMGTGDGTQANNPWLQELPDPITKVVWDNYITMNPKDMEGFQFNTYIAQQGEAGMAKVTTSSGVVELPVMPVPGQKRNTIGIALGYGKGFEGDRLVGKNVFPHTTVMNGTICYGDFDVKVEPIEGEYPLASSQTHHTMMGRKIVNETTIDTYKKGKEFYNEPMMLADAYGEKKEATEINLWDDHPVGTFGHRWGMAIDLNTCTGCSACVTACGSENNIPIVGRDEVKRNRTMFWMRIDRYFSSDMDKEKAANEDVGAKSMYEQMEDPSEYPSVVHQPVMCQHCNHAPCETVCPVAATTHSNEGLNHMAYNRCVGTRYCANNCPYKVRRFNWFQYDSYKKFTGINPAQEDLGRMVLNPDVTVRSRGVMEKCSMCIQRIQAGKLEAKKQGEKVQNGAIETACSSACPTNAITFGDINDKAHTVNGLSTDDRMYHLLEEVGTQPNIMYLTKVRNNNSEEA